MSSTNTTPNNQPSSGDANSSTMRTQQRRGSVTGAALSNLFRSSSNAQNGGGFSGPVTAAAINEQRRRLSISTLGLSGTAPAAPPASFGRRGSISTNSDVIDETASEEELDASARTAPVTPFHRRMSFGAPAMWSTMRGQAGSPGSSNPDQGFIWSEQLRSRAESSVAAAAAAAGGSQPRASFSFAPVFSSSPPRTANNANGGGAPQSTVSPHHDRAKSVSDMPAPPAQLPRAREHRKPDHMQERILKGDFYMD